MKRIAILLILVALPLTAPARILNGHATKPPAWDKVTSEPALTFRDAPLLDVTPSLGSGFVQPTYGIDRECNGYDRQRCGAACGGSRTSSCLSVTGGVRYCSACISVGLLTEATDICEEPAS